MSRPEFTFRPNLKKTSHREAWEILKAVPMREKSDFVVQAILENKRRESLENTLRRVIREELKGVSTQPVKQDEQAVPQEMMDFLASLTDET